MGGTGRSVHPVSEVRCWEVLKNVLVGYFIIRPALLWSSLTKTSLREQGIQATQEKYKRRKTKWEGKIQLSIITGTINKHRPSHRLRWQSHLSQNGVECESARFNSIYLNLPWTDHVIFCYKARIMTIYENIHQSKDCLGMKKCKVKSG